jgi:diguanylate cyclase (GGDEF)-like protein/PAS domain S-box-containing protein
MKTDYAALQTEKMGDEASLYQRIEALEQQVAQLQATLEQCEQQSGKGPALRQFQRAVEQSPVSIVITDVAGSIEYVNPKFTQVTGYTLDEALGQNPRVLKSGDKPPESYKELWETIKSGKEWHGEFHNQRKNGELFWEWASISPIFNTEGSITHFLAVKEDITARKQAEFALQESEALYRFLTDNVTDMISRHAADGTFHYVSPACTLLLGYTSNELIGQSIFDLFHPEDITTIVPAQFDPSSSVTTELLRNRLRHKDGHYVWVEATLKTLHDPHTNAVSEVIAVSRDITQRKQIESALEQSLAVLQATIESVAEGILVMTQERDVVCYNQKTAQLWNVPEAWFTSFNADERVEYLLGQVHDPQDLLRQFREQTIDPEGESYGVVELKDGRLIEAYGTPYRVADEVAGRVWSFRDVTEQRRSEEALRESQSRLEAIFDNAAVGVMLLDEQGRYIQINGRWARMLGLTLEETYQNTYIDALNPADVAVNQTNLQAVARGDVPGYRLEQRYIRKDGSTFWGDLSVRGLRNNQDIVENIVAIITDISERKQIEDTLNATNEQLLATVQELQQHNQDMRLLNEMSDQLQRCLTAEEAYHVVTHSANRLFGGHSGGLYLSHPISGTFELVAAWGNDPPPEQSFEPGTCRALREGKISIIERAHIDGYCTHLNTETTVPCICVPLVLHGERMGVLRLSNSEIIQPEGRERWERLASMVAEHLSLTLINLQLRERLRDQSIRDPLTGLYNRRYLDETLQRELQRASRYRHSVGIIMLDIDHFKQFNTNYGHDGGDVLLRAVGAFLQNQVRGDDIACRYGGEEFTLILPGASLEDTQRRAEQVRRDVQHIRIEHNGQSLDTITMSLGVAAFPRCGRDDETVIKAADQALFQAKADGRNKVVTATPDSSI